jgi:phospholipid/cholesterol/gamma-HCH transport system substrate-binding protein
MPVKVPVKRLENQDPFRLGLVAFAVGLLVCIVLVVVSIVPFGHSTYTAMIENTAGLKSGEDVEISGVSVGQVRSVSLDGDQVKVRFTVKNGIKLGSLTTGTVKVATLLGTHYFQLDPLGGGSLANDTIPVSRTSVPYNLQDVLDKGNSQLGKLDPVALANMLTAITDTIGPAEDDIGPALTGVARLSDAVAARSDQTGQLLTAAQSVTNQLSDSSADLIQLMKQTNLVVGEVTARRAAIHKLLVETTALSTNLTGVITRSRADIQPALSNLNLVLTTLRAQDKALKHVLDVMAPSIRYLTNASGNGPWVDLGAPAPAIPPDDVLCKMGNCS